MVPGYIYQLDMLWLIGVMPLQKSDSEFDPIVTIKSCNSCVRGVKLVT
jgi:hypothetical protein